MASIQRDPSDNYHIHFRFGGRRFKRSLKTKDEREAVARVERLEETLRLVASGRIELPNEADIAVFLLSDGKLKAKRKIQGTLFLKDFFDEFFDQLPAGNLEETTLVIRPG